MPLKTRKASIFKDQKTSNFKKSLVLMKYGGKKVLKIVLIQKKKNNKFRWRYESRDWDLRFLSGFVSYPGFIKLPTRLKGIKTMRILTHYHPAMPFGNRKVYFRGSSQFSIVTIQKISPPWNLKFNYLGIFQSLKLRISKGKNPLNFSLAKFLSK